MKSSMNLCGAKSVIMDVDNILLFYIHMRMKFRFVMKDIVNVRMYVIDRASMSHPENIIFLTISSSRHNHGYSPWCVCTYILYRY